MSKQQETKLKEKVIKDIEDHYGDRAYVLKTQEKSRKGVLDLIICLDGNYVSIELKIEDEEPSRLQEINIHRVRKAGGLAFYTTPARWPKQFDMIKERQK